MSIQTKQTNDQDAGAPHHRVFRVHHTGESLLPNVYVQNHTTEGNGKSCFYNSRSLCNARATLHGQ